MKSCGTLMEVSRELDQKSLALVEDSQTSFRLRTDSSDFRLNLTPSWGHMEGGDPKDTWVPQGTSPKKVLTNTLNLTWYYDDTESNLMKQRESKKKAIHIFVSFKNYSWLHIELVALKYINAFKIHGWKQTNC